MKQRLAFIRRLDEVDRSIAGEDHRMRVSVRLHLHDAGLRQRTEFWPGGEAILACVHRRHVAHAVVDGRSDDQGTARAPRNGVCDGLQAMLPQQRRRHHPQARERVVERQHHASRSRMPAMPDERGQFAGPDGSIAVLGEIRKRRIEHFGCGFVKMKDRQQRANAAAEDERRDSVRKEDRTRRARDHRARRTARPASRETSGVQISTRIAFASRARAARARSVAMVSFATAWRTRPTPLSPVWAAISSTPPSPPAAPCCSSASSCSRDGSSATMHMGGFRLRSPWRPSAKR